MKIVKVLATGTYKRFMWLDTGVRTFCIRINDELYRDLKLLGVPTSQSLRKKHDSKV